MNQPSMIFTDIDYDAQGKQVDWLHLPHSVNRSAYGAIAIPIAVIRNGDGPTVFLMAGNHGDEYEGQITLAKLIRELVPEDIQGRVIILPAANLPAAMAGARVSPIDQGNLNRAFPGDAQGTPTWAIAHYIDSVLYPLADYHHDLHSGGSSLKYVPFCSMRKSGGPARPGLAGRRVWRRRRRQPRQPGDARARGAQFPALLRRHGQTPAKRRATTWHPVDGSVQPRALRLRPRGRPARTCGRPGRRGARRRSGRHDPFCRQPGAGTRTVPFPPLRHGGLPAPFRPCRARRLRRPSVEEPGRVGIEPGRVERGDCVAHLATDC